MAFVAESIDMTVDVTSPPGFGIAGGNITVVGKAPGPDAAGFAGIAKGAEANCQASGALAGVDSAPDVTRTLHSTTFNRVRRPCERAVSVECLP